MMWIRPDERSGWQLQTAMRGCLPAMRPALVTVLLLAAVLAGSPRPAFAQTKTTVADTIHGPDGSLPSGQIVISANSTFTAADGSVVFHGAVATVKVTNGAFSVALIPNAGSTPSGTSYSAIYKLAGVPYWHETWVVPQSSSPVNLATVRSAMLSGPPEMVSSSQMPALTGDTSTTAGSTVTTTSKVNGVAYPANPAVNSLPMVVGTNQTAYEALPDCTDTGGNHLNFDNTNHSFSCGTSGGTSGGTSQVFSVRAYGAKGDGTTDDTAAVQAAINAAMANGGTVYFPAGNYLISGSLTIPNDGATPPNQNPLRLTGALMDAGSTGSGKVPANGAILNLTETSDTVAKIDTRGTGYMEIDHLTLEDTAGDSVPFIQTTNTVLHVHDDSFVGSKNTTACDQDAIVLGGSGTGIDGSATSRFQGYGTVIENNWFNHIRRMVYGRVSANGVMISGNFDWNESGSNLANGAAIEFDDTPNVPAADAGNSITNNFIEFGNYAYGIKLTQSVDNQIIGNSMFDPGTGTLAGIYFDSTANYNGVWCGYSGGKPCATDAAGNNTIYDNSGDSPNKWPLPLQFTGSAGQVDFPNGYGAKIDNSQGDNFEPLFASTAGFPILYFQFTPSGQGPLDDLSLEHTTAYDRLSIGVPGGSGYFGSLDKDLRLIAGASTGVTWIGNSAGQPTYFSNSLMHVGTKAAFTGQIVQTPVAFASAPACNSGNEGSVQAIMDSTVNTWGSTIAGGGTNHVLGYCDGTHWTVMAQ